MNINKKYKNIVIFTIILALSFGLVLVNNTNAQDLDTASSLEEFKNLAVEAGANNIDEVNKIKIFWHDLKDTLNLALTFDKVKKAEKELKFAEKRIRWANVLSVSDSQDKKDLAFELSAKADEYISKIADNSESVFKDVGEKEENILENILIHQNNKAKVWENLESKIAVENSEDFMRIRDQIENKQEGFFERLSNNSNIPKDLSQKIREEAQNIREKRENRKNFVERNREQLDNLNDSQNSDLKEFLEKRRQDMMHFNEEFQKEFQNEPKGNDAVNTERENNKKNNNIPERQQNHLQNSQNQNEAREYSNDSELDFDSEQYQQFLRMLDSSQAVDSAIDPNETLE
jgi:hypothetical protein